MEIRPAAGDDHDWAARLMAANDPWITLRRGPDACQEAVRRSGSELFIAAEGEERLGFVLLAERGLAGSPYVASIAVTEAARGRSVGSALLQFAETRYPAAQHIFLLVSSFNPRARELYERHGYRQVGEIPDYVVDGHAELVMHKRLK